MPVDSNNPVSVGSVGKSLGSSIASAGLGSVIDIGKSFIQMDQQKSLLKNEYDQYMNYMRKLGASPASMISGLGGVQGTPSVNQIGATPDLGANAASLQNAQSRASEVQKGNEYKDMLLTYEPKKFDADVSEAFSRIRLNRSQQGLNAQMKKYYSELEKDVRTKRPWQIASLQQGLLIGYQQLNKLVEETNTIRKQGNLFDSQSGYYRSMSDLNEHLKDYYDDAAYNQRMQGNYYGSLDLTEGFRRFRYEFENNLLRSGWDPQQPYWQNMLRIGSTDPSALKDFIGNSVEALNIIDGKLETSLGKHYKRSIALGVGAYMYGNHVSKNVDRLSGMLPMLIGRGMPAVTPMPSSGFLIPNNSMWYSNY